MRNIHNLLTLAALAALAACAELPQSQDARLTYETQPEGAMLFEGARSLGPAPLMRIYPHDGKSSNIRTPEVTAVWPSGAKESFWTLLPLGSDRETTIERPKNAPGLEADLEHAKKVAHERQRAAQRQKEATARDIARSSARCKEQQAKGGTSPIDDC